MQGIYVHIPFCAAKCAYCDFLSFAGKNADMPGYMQSLTNELQGYAKRYAKDMVQTIFFGGGTPTTVPVDFLAAALGVIRQSFTVAENAEITIEANPETVSYDVLCALRGAGFNRVSFGVQAFDNEMLRRIGRVHTAETAERAVTNARQAGFANISIDLMFGLPGQTMQDWQATLDVAVGLNPNHISCYSLILEESTPLAKAEGVLLPDDEADRAMYAEAIRRLREAGYDQYEISNFAKPGYASRHNVMYWTGGDYIGAGLGAHSLLEGRRICNTSDLGAYMQGDFGRETLETLTEADCRAEFMILGLRMTNGVSEDEFHRRFGVTFARAFGKEIDGLVAEGLLVQEQDRLRLSARGVDISNRVFARFLSDGD